MGWKNLSYWLRGGVIGIIIYIVLLPFAFIFPPPYYIISLLTIPLNPILNSGIFGDNVIVFIIIKGIYLFLLSALIGLVIGKIKQKVKSNK